MRAIPATCSSGNWSEPRSWGLDYQVGPELEFFLFKPHANGDLLPLQPHDYAGYFDVSTDLAHSVRRQMVDALQAMGIDVEASHHEVANGQSEIDFKYGPALVTADNANTMRTTLKGSGAEERTALHLYAQACHGRQRFGHARTPEPVGQAHGRHGDV